MIDNVILVAVDLQGLSNLSGKENLRIILLSVPDGKTKGICQQSDLDTGEVVDLHADCIERCEMFGCFMFGSGFMDKDGTVHKVFTPHLPEH